MRKYILIVITGWIISPVFGQHPPQDKNWEVVFEDDFDSFQNSIWQKGHNLVQGKWQYEHPQVHIQDNVFGAKRFFAGN